MKNLNFKLVDALKTTQKYELCKIIRIKKDAEKALAAEAIALDGIEELKIEAKATLDKKVARKQLFVKYFLQAGARIFTCYAGNSNKALAYAIKRSKGECYCRIISFEIVSKKDYLREKLMMRLSSPLAVRRGMTVERFLNKFPELLKSKRLYAFRSFSNNRLFVNSIKECTNYYAAQAVARQKEDIELFFDELLFYMNRLHANGYEITYRLRKLKINSLNDLHADFYNAITLKDFVMNSRKVELMAIIYNMRLCYIDGIERCLNLFSKNPNGFGYGYEFDAREVVFNLANFSDNKIKSLNKLLKINHNDLPQYVIWNILTGYFKLNIMKYSPNLGINPGEALDIAYYGVFQAMIKHRCGRITNVPKKILSELYKTGKTLQEYLGGLFFLYPNTVDYTVYKFFVDNQENQEMWEKRCIHLFGKKTIEYNFAGLFKYAKPNDIRKSIKKTFDSILNRLLSEPMGNVDFPKLSIDKKYPGIFLLDSEEKIEEAAVTLNNCMAKCYMSAAKEGKTFLFFASLKNEIAGFEVYDGKLTQLYGKNNYPVSDDMRSFVISFLRDNKRIFEESIIYLEKSNKENKWYNDPYLLAKKPILPNLEVETCSSNRIPSRTEEVNLL